MNNPTCPHCSYEFDDEETWHSTFLDIGEVYSGCGDMSELTCPNEDCKSNFNVICVHDIRWKAVDEDGDDL